MLRILFLSYVLAGTSLLVNAGELDEFDFENLTQTTASPVSGVLSASVLWLDSQDTNTAVSTNFGRLEYRRSGDFGKIEAHVQLDFNRGSSNRALDALQQSAINDRYLDLETDIVSSSRTQLAARIDWLYYQKELRNSRISIGRKPITLGFGRIWFPVDQHAPFSFLDLDRLYKSGVDMLQLDYFPMRDSVFTSVLSGENRESEDSGLNILQSFQFTLSDSKFMLNVSKRQEQTFASLSYQKNNIRGTFDGYSEFLVGRLSSAERSIWGEKNYHRALVGITTKLGKNVFLNAEYLYQSLGVNDESQYSRMFERSRNSKLTFLGAARDYLAIAISAEFTPLTTYEVLAIYNLNDNSANLSGLLKHSYTDNLELRCALAYTPGTNTIKKEFEYQPNIIQLGINYYF